jgi:N-acetylneuraminate lyase
MLPPWAPDRPSSVDVLVDSLSVVANATDLPLFYYHFPSMTGMNLLISDLLEKAFYRLPTLKGVK